MATAAVGAGGVGGGEEDGYSGSNKPMFMSFWGDARSISDLFDLQLQQLASNNIATTPSLADGSGGGGGGNNHSHPPRQEGSMVTAPGEGGGGGGGGEGDGHGRRNMSMSERARMARVPLPETALRCPRCHSTNTKFCYFNNYSLTQPRHLCRACRRYWTRGGALRNVLVPGVYLRRSKRNTKPETTAGAAVAGKSSSTHSSTT